MNQKFLVAFYLLFIFFSSFSILFIHQAMQYGGGSEISIFILFFPLGYIIYHRFGFGFFLKTLTLLSVWGLLIEYIGLTTDFPYSQFVYVGSLGYKIFGILPWTVALSWVPLMIGSVALIYMVSENKFLRITLPVLLLVMFDLLLDPVAVNIGMWKYTKIGVYFGVPVQNFAGWSFSGLVGSLICFYLFQNTEKKDMFGIWYSFLLSILFWTIIAIGKGLYVPGMFGIILIFVTLVISFKYNEKVSHN